MNLAPPASAVSPAELRATLDRAFAEALPAVCLGMTVVYLIVPLGHLVALPAPALRILLPLSLGSLALFAGCWLAMRRHGPPPPGRAHALGALLSGVLATNSIVHLLLTSEPRQTTNLSLLIIAMGCVFTSLRWMLALCAAFMVAWLLVFARFAQPADWTHFGFLNFMSVALAVTVLRIHVRLLESNAREAHAREEQAQQMQRLSLTDPLTGLANRRAFDAALRREWDRAARGARSLAVAVIDVDHFKRYNDSFGHIAGDECLVQVAGRLRAAVRSIDTLGRFGGEEFIVLLPEADAAQALEAGERVRAAVEAAALPHAASGVRDTGVVTVSIGVAATLPSGEASPGALLEAADRALYQAKAAGRNRSALAAPEPATSPPA